ncbi:hypothetical protein [Bradyrhizobium sp. USDA 3650]
MPYPQKITFGEMRAMGVRGVLVYCRHRCGHHTEISADAWGDDVKLSDIEPNTKRGKRGAEIRPNYDPAKMGTTG